MSVMDARPSGIEIKGYAGDTLSFYINSSDSFSGYSWSGQVRSTHDASIVDAEFTIGPTESFTDNGVTRYRTPVVLSSTDTRTLADIALESDVVPQQLRINGVRSTISSVPTYVGYWDVQITLGDTIKTVVQGTITIDADVTRV